MESTLMLLMMAFSADVSYTLKETGKTEFTVDEINKVLFDKTLEFTKRFTEMPKGENPSQNIKLSD